MLWPEGLGVANGTFHPWPMNILHYTLFVGQSLWGCNCFVTKCNVGRV